MNNEKFKTFVQFASIGIQRKAFNPKRRTKRVPICKQKLQTASCITRGNRCTIADNACVRRSSVCAEQPWEDLNGFSKVNTLKARIILSMSFSHAHIFHTYKLLRKPASWIVADCERSEYKGGWGAARGKEAKNPTVGWWLGLADGNFSLLCTMFPSVLSPFLFQGSAWDRCVPSRANPVSFPKLHLRPLRSLACLARFFSKAPPDTVAFPCVLSPFLFQGSAWHRCVPSYA